MSQQAYDLLQIARHRALREGAEPEVLVQATIAGIRAARTFEFGVTDAILEEMDLDLSLALDKLERRNPESTTIHTPIR